MKNAAEIIRLLNNLIRLGTIAEVQTEPPRARVQTGQNLTDWLPWITLRAANTSTWEPPVIGEQVVLFSPGGDLAQGIIVMGLYSDANPAPANSLDVHHRQYPDGTQTTYNHVENRLDVLVEGEVQIYIQGNASVEVGGDADVQVHGNLVAGVGGNATVQVTGDITATADGKAAVTAGGDATVDAPQIKLNGGAGVVTGAHICAFTGTPHSSCSSTVKAGA